MAILIYILDCMDETVIFDENSLGEEYQLIYRELKGEFSRMYLLIDKHRRDLALGNFQLAT